MTLPSGNPFRWRGVGLMIALSLGIHAGASILATMDSEEILEAGGAETPATTIGEAFADLVVASSFEPTAKLEADKSDEVVEPLKAAQASAVRPRPAERLLPDITPTASTPQDPVSAQSALVARTVDTTKAGVFIKSEQSLERPLEFQSPRQISARPPEAISPQEPSSPENPAKTPVAPSKTPSLEAATSPPPTIAPQQSAEVARKEPEPAQHPALQPAEPDLSRQEEPDEFVRANFVPVPQQRPKPLLRTPPQTAKAQPQKRIKQDTRKTRPAASTSAGNSNRNAQKGSAKSRGKSSQAGNAKRSNYPGLVARKLRRALRYPAAAKRKRLRGQVYVKFTIDKAGKASGIRIAKSSGSGILDQAAVETVRRASPFPQIPADAGRRRWSFTVPLVFKR